jgi:3'(2'), 5'-bisphosphate nucleotidase
LGEARERTPIGVRRCPKEHVRVLVSRSHLDAATAAYVDRLSAGELVARGSALKFALLAEGAADLYPPAGGGVLRPDGEPLRYGASDFRIPAFIAFGDRAAMPAP